MPRCPIEFVHRIDDGLIVRADVIDTLVEVEDPVQGLRRRRYVIPLGAEDEDWRAYVAQIDAGAIASYDFCRCELVADEQLIDDELHLGGVEQHKTAPVLLELEVTRRLGVDLAIEIVLFRPESIGWIEVLEVANEPGAVKLAVAEVARQRGQPTAARAARPYSASDSGRAPPPSRRAVSPRR